MAHAFPEKSVVPAHEMAKRYFELHGNKDSLLKRAYMIFYGFGEQSQYGFTHQFYTGNYAPWFHEMQEQNISQYNCTTIVPYLYTYFEAFGVKPEIVQFFDWRDTDLHSEKKKLFQDASHFALLLDVGKTEKYLCDMFWKRFGAITSQDAHEMRVRNYPKNKVCLREFRSMISYTPEEFAAMMERLHTPADSLDVLVAGQKFTREKYNGVACDSMVYYDDALREVKVRVFVPQKGLMNKVIYSMHTFDPERKLRDSHLRLTWGKQDYWNFVEDERVVAQLNFDEANMLIKKLGNVSRSHKRITPELRRESLLELVDELWTKLSVEEQEAIRLPRAVRTLYEYTSPEQNYAFSVTEWDADLRKNLEKMYALEDERMPLKRKVFLHYGKFERVSDIEAKRLKLRKRKITKNLDDLGKEFDELQKMRIYHKKMYQRNMDKVVFVKQFEGKNVEDVEAEVLSISGDLRVGYLAMITDFLAYIKDAKKELTLDVFIDSIGEKVKARVKRDGC